MLRDEAEANQAHAGSGELPPEASHRVLLSATAGCLGAGAVLSHGSAAVLHGLPVPTAMIGQMETDSLQPVVYIGTLILTQITTLAGWLYLLRHPDFTTTPVDVLRAGVIGDLAAIILFLIALAIAVFVPSLGYAGLLVLLLTGVVTTLLSRASRQAPRPSTGRG